MKTKYYLILFSVILVLQRNTSLASDINVISYIPGDTTYVFSYDDSGNRTKREIVLSKSGTIPQGISSENEDPILDKITSHEIRIFPNPTKGVLKVEIPELPEDKSNLYVYNLQGRMLINKTVTKHIHNIDLHKYPSGMYILKIVLGTEVSEWKILKD
ncbi:T9SS type A sorting domain-containing protein [Draconibacterium sp.]|nr:T9SS type A sorting domain-containing protein [Draconibacterium sp.]